MPNLTNVEDISRHQTRLAALDVQKASYLAKQAANPKSADSQGLRDLSAAAARAASEIRRLSGPEGSD
jgi:hypothetical protein